VVVSTVPLFLFRVALYAGFSPRFFHIVGRGPSETSAVSLYFLAHAYTARNNALVY